MFRAAIGILASIGCLFAVSAARPVRADDTRTEEKGEMGPAYPRTKAELEKWLAACTSVGKTRPQDVVAVFGKHYRHPPHLDGHGNQSPDEHRFTYDLDALGVSAHAPGDEIRFTFDEQTDRLEYVGVGQPERQTGFHLEQTRGE